MRFEFLGREINVHSEGMAIISGKRILSYDQLNSEIQKVAGILYVLGIRKGTHITIISDNNIDFVILVLALWRLQAVPVPMNTRLLDEEIAKLIEHSESEFIFVHSDLQSRLIKIKKPKVFFPLEYSGDISFNEPPQSSYSDQPALILYTSGTTGSPKGVMLTYSNLLSSADSADYLIGHTPEDRWLSSLPYYHIGGISIPVRAFLSGAGLIIPESIKASDIATALHKFGPTLASFVTTTLKQLLDSESKPNTGLRLVLLGGGPVEDELIIRASMDGWKLAKVYGSTETSSLVSAILLDGNSGNISSAGRPLPPNQINIIDENGEELSIRQTGEIVISGRSVMKGYWKNPALTDQKLRNNKYHSGDLGYLDNEGFLFIESRRTDLIISGGENVNPLEVENAILKFRGVKEVCVFPLKDKIWGQTVAAAIVTSQEKPDESKVYEDDLKAFLKESISPFKIPKRIFFAGELPKTSLGKLKREIVRQTYEDESLEN